MRQGLNKWVAKYGEPITPELYHGICERLSIDKDNEKEACWGLLNGFDKGDLDEKELLQGLIAISGKPLEEVGEALIPSGSASFPSDSQ